MKKYIFAAAVLTALTVFAPLSGAQDAGGDSGSATTVQEKAGGRMFKGMHKSTPDKPQKQIKSQKNKEHKKTEKMQQTPLYSSRIMQKKIEDINENYQDALQKIAKSSLSQGARNMLIQQAEENRDLALKQLKERMDLCARHACARMQYQCELTLDKKNRKAVREVDNI